MAKRKNKKTKEENQQTIALTLRDLFNLLELAFNASKPHYEDKQNERQYVLNILKSILKHEEHAMALTPFGMVNYMKNNLAELIEKHPEISKEIVENFANAMLSYMKNPIGYVPTEHFQKIAQALLKTVPKAIEPFINKYIKNEEERKKMIEKLYSKIDSIQISLQNYKGKLDELKKYVDKKLQSIRGMTEEDKKQIMDKINEVEQQIASLSRSLPGTLQTDGGEYTKEFQDISQVLTEKEARKIVAYKITKNIFGEEYANRIFGIRDPSKVFEKLQQYKNAVEALDEKQRKQLLEYAKNQFGESSEIYQLLRVLLPPEEKKGIVESINLRNLKKLGYKIGSTAQKFAGDAAKTFTLYGE